MESAKDFLVKAVAMAEVALASPPELRDRGLFARHAYLSGLLDAYTLLDQMYEEIHEAATNDDDRPSNA